MGLSEISRAAVPICLGLFALFTPFSIAGAHISLGLAVIAALLDPLSRAQMAALRRHPLVWPIAAWVLVNLLAVAFAEDPAGSATKLKKLALLALVPLAALPGVRCRLRQILAILIASTLVVSAWGLGEHLFRGGGMEARLHGISGFYMTVAGILMIVALLTVAELVAATKDPRARRLTFLSVAGVTILVALLATYTRGSWLGLAAGLAWLLRRRGLLLLGIVGVAALFFAFGPPDGRARLASTVDPAHPYNAERVLIWQHGVDLLRERPLTGTGQLIPRELMEREVETEHGVLRVHSHMHNAYLQIAVSMGLPALAVFGWLVVVLFRTGLRAPRGGLQNLWEEGLVAAYPAVLIALLVNGLFEWNFGDSEILGLFWLLTGGVLGIETGADD